MKTLTATPTNDLSGPSSLRFALPLIIAGALSLSACATKPNRGGPPPERGSANNANAESSRSGLGNRGRAEKSSGVFLHPVAALFSGMDINKDKAISRAELQSGAAQEWSQFTAKPSAVDFSQWSVKTLGSTDAMPNFMAFDADFNGVISKAEFLGRLEAEFKRLDKNRDDRLERYEMIIAFAAPLGERKQGGGKGERGKGGRPPPR